MRVSQTTPERVLAAARERGMTIACAESLTGGQIASRLVDVPGASDAFIGGVVAYDASVKVGVLGVDADLLASHGPVSAEVASAMASGVRALMGADIAVATTGAAGPTPHGGRAPGTYYVALADASGVVVNEVVHGGSREQVRDAAVATALELLIHALGETP